MIVPPNTLAAAAVNPSSRLRRIGCIREVGMIPELVCCVDWPKCPGKNGKIKQAPRLVRVARRPGSPPPELLNTKVRTSSIVGNGTKVLNRPTTVRITGIVKFRSPTADVNSGDPALSGCGTPLPDYKPQCLP